jgi:hypothetical protein
VAAVASSHQLISTGYKFPCANGGCLEITSNARQSARPDGRNARLEPAPSRSVGHPHTCKGCPSQVPSQVPSPSLVRHPRQMRAQSLRRRPAPNPIRHHASRPNRHPIRHRASRLHANPRPNALRRCWARRQKGWRSARDLRKTSQLSTSMHL